MYSGYVIMGVHTELTQTIDAGNGELGVGGER